MRLVRRLVRRTRRMSGRRRRGGRRFKRMVTPLFFCWSQTGASGNYSISGEAGAITAPPAGWNVGGASAPLPTAAITTWYSDLNNLSSGSVNYIDVPFGFNFTLGDIVRVQDFTSLFDQYKLNYIKLKFIPTWSELGSELPRLEWSLDHDDVTLPVPGTFRERGNVKSAQMRKPITIGIKPTQLMPTLRSGSGATYPTVVSSKWNNSTAIDIEHFGLKGFFRGMPAFNTTASAANNLAKIKIEATYYFETRGVQ